MNGYSQLNYSLQIYNPTIYRYEIRWLVSIEQHYSEYSHVTTVNNTTLNTYFIEFFLH